MQAVAEVVPRKEHQALKKEYHTLQQEHAILQAELAHLKRLIYGVRSERYVPEDPGQLALGLQQDAGPAPAQPEEEQISYRRRKPQGSKPVRTALPAHLPREEETLTPEMVPEGSRKIGEEVTEVFEYRPGTLYVRRIVREKYAQPAGEGVVIAELPTLPIPRSNVGPGLLAYLLISKFVDHLPFYRQAGMFRRQGVELAESTLNGWFSATCSLLEPLYAVLKHQVRHSAHLQADETPIRVMDRKKHKATHQGFFWVYHAPQQGAVVFDYRPGRSRAGPQEFLSEFTGKLQTDGYTGYDELANKIDIIHVGCMAHIRRKFFEARDNDRARAERALQFIGRLYAVEEQCRQEGLNHEQRLQRRTDLAAPVMTEFRAWLESELGEVLPKSKIGKAIGYALGQWPRMRRYLEHGEVEIDNNLIENCIRPVAVGRKNYLFAGSHQAARRAAMIYSLLGTCKINDVEPYAWLKDILSRIPDHPVNRLEELLPGRS